MDFADFISPLPVQKFLDETFDRKPLHIPAAGAAAEARAALLPWARLNALLGIAGYWQEQNTKLVRNGVAVPPEQYLDYVGGVGGERRADPAKIESLLSLGASLVADSIESALIEVKQVTTMLSTEFLGTSGANAYCSFHGVQAFRSHFDLHDVFAVQCEGEKVWRIYRDRAPDPVEQNAEPDAQAEIDRIKGPLLMEVRMRPGDLLYLPRGYYHDALASSDASLHVTFSVARHTGRILFRILEALAMSDGPFRAYLPDGRTQGGRLLFEQVEALSHRAAELMRTPAFLRSLVNEQLDLAKPFRTLALPERPQPTLFARTRRPWRIELRADGAMLGWDGGETPLGLMEAPTRWFLGQNVVSLQQLVAHYPQHGEPALTAVVQLLERLALIEPHRGPNP